MADRLLQCTTEALDQFLCSETLSDLHYRSQELDQQFSAVLHAPGEILGPVVVAMMDEREDLLEQRCTAVRNGILHTLNDCIAAGIERLRAHQTENASPLLQSLIYSHRTLLERIADGWDVSALQENMGNIQSAIRTLTEQRLVCTVDGNLYLSPIVLKLLRNRTNTASDAPVTDG